MVKRKPIAERIRDAFGPNDYCLNYFDLMLRVFPRDQYPNATRYAAQGGPAGCSMALSAAIRRMGLSEHYERGHRYVHRPKKEPSE